MSDKKGSVPDGLPRGTELLSNPLLNKGTAFTEAERDALGLRGLLPPRVLTQQQQLFRLLENYNRKTSNLDKFVYLAALHDRNERLFYRFVTEYIETMMPIIYTPTVGEACRQYAHIFRRPRGMYVSIRHRGKIKEVLKNWPVSDVRVIVVSDGERILGLGDLGANGMGIPVGKLALYTACAGVPPEQTLPILLDVGTNNGELLEDPLYMGTPQPRVRGEEYDEFLEEFVDAVQEVFPGCLLQFEDFGNTNAFRLLDRYRDKICTFNDDIQGTAAVTIAGLYAALGITGGRLRDQTILFYGAGEAAFGIANLFVHALERHGIPPEQSRERCWMVDSRGLVVTGRDHLNEQKRQFAHDHEFIRDLEEIVRVIEPTALIGVSGQPQTFTRRVIGKMSDLNEHPVIFALSNPTSKSECTAAQAYEWSDGQAVFASGSPFDPVTYKGRTFIPGQGNNAFIFPGLGLGVMASGAKRVTDDMFIAAARALCRQVDRSSLDMGRVYPSQSEIQNVSLEIAVEVFEEAVKSGHATVEPPEDLRGYIAGFRFDPTYDVYVEE